MNRSILRQSLMGSFLITVICCTVSMSVAQQKRQRPSVAGDREILALPPNTVIPQEFYIERPTLKCAGFEWYVSGAYLLLFSLSCARLALRHLDKI
jgi:hypothetical protein